MRSILPLPSSILALFLLAAAPAPQPLPNAHAHNDNEHPRPLHDALDHGCCSVEADVHLVGGTLLVAHDPRALRPDRTLQALYLDPLRKRVADHAGRVHRDSPVPFTLMIDVKSDARATYAALRTLLDPYRPLLTVYHRDGRVTPGPVRIILSGNRDRATLAAELTRLAALDGRPEDLDAAPPPPASLVPWISANWTAHFKWKGQGPLPPDEAAKLKSLIDKAHAQGRQLRFWAAPDTEPGWRVLRDAGVDLINTDHLPALARFLRGG